MRIPAGVLNVLADALVRATVMGRGSTFAPVNRPSAVYFRGSGWPFTDFTVCVAPSRCLRSAPDVNNFLTVSD